jgi:hypothetical protein
VVIDGCRANAGFFRDHAHAHAAVAKLHDQVGSDLEKLLLALGRRKPRSD